MATVQSYTKEYMQPILDAVVVDAHLEADGELVLEHQDGSESSAGNISLPLSTIYPVGSIYLSVNNVNPGTLFGGTWEAFGAGRMPIGVNPADTRFDTAAETGGTDQIAANHLPTHTHAIGGSTGADAAHTHPIPGSDGSGWTSSDSPAHAHGVNINSGTVSADHVHSMAGEKTFYFAGSVAAAATDSDAFARGAASGRAFSNAIINAGNTGGISANHYHNVNGSTATSGAAHWHQIPTATEAGSSHTHSLPANTGNNTTAADKFLPPFIAVYMWRRTA